MATKLYNSHLSEIFLNSKQYYILDTYIALVHISSDIKGKFLIQTYSSNKCDLIHLVEKYVKASYKTICNSIDNLIAMNILDFNLELHSWIIVDMENMVKSKSDATIPDSDDKQTFTGYTTIREFFLTKDFSKLKAREKRIVIYMAQLRDSKKGKFYNDYTMNLLKSDSKWLKVIRTKSKYYAKYTIDHMIKKYENLFEDNSTLLRESDLAPNRITQFKYSIDCKVIKKDIADGEAFNLVTLTNNKEYLLVKQKIEFANITLSKTKIMHLVRAISNISEWFLKERVSQIIINKYISEQIHHNNNVIHSLPAYVATVINSVIKDYKHFLDVKKNNKIATYEIGEYYTSYVKNDGTLNVASEKEFTRELAAI